MGRGDGAEYGGSQPSCADRVAALDACGRARAAGEVVLAELDQNIES
jgi:hypothetical protein